MTEKYRVVVESLNLRDEPSIHGNIIGILKKNDTVEFISMSGDDYWLRISSPTGEKGWASHKYLQLTTEVVDSDFPWLKIALGEVGVKEFPGNADNPRIVEYLHSTNLPAPDRNNDETYWCSAFVNWCVERAGYEGTDSAWARTWLNWGKEINTPRKGCIVVFKRDNGGHVGFYMGETETKIKVLGGNQSNEVNISDYPKSNFLGYRISGNVA
ncbi:TIGR02594 family protein [Aeromonas sp. 602200]|uniref:TIGR02594 family protein n=1 Tax=Aeromonas sp. 602200 TaxID=2712040 RepID=UPI003BA3B91F